LAHGRQVELAAGATEGLIKRHGLVDGPLELFTSLGSTVSHRQLQSGNVFKLECFLKVSLRSDRNQFLLIVEVVELDGPNFLEGVTESVTGFKGKGLVGVGHLEAFGFSLEGDFDAAFVVGHFWLNFDHLLVSLIII